MLIRISGASCVVVPFGVPSPFAFRGLEPEVDACSVAPMWYGRRPGFLMFPKLNYPAVPGALRVVTVPSQGAVACLLLQPRSIWLGALSAWASASRLGRISADPD